MPPNRLRPAAAPLLALACALAAGAAQALCSSETGPQPAALLERFVSADCDTCWSDPATPKATGRELAIDWIVPSPRGEDAPLAKGETREALARLEALRRPVPARADAVRGTAEPSPSRLRLAQGEPLNDYIGTSIELRPGAAGPVWLLLVEELPAGTEGSPVPRNLVRNVFRPSWDLKRPLTRAEQVRLYEARSMQIPDGTHRERLRLVAVAEDARGRIKAIARTQCEPEGTK
jgi:hypothetical protein